MDVKGEFCDIAVELLGSGEINRDAVVKVTDLFKGALRSSNKEFVVKTNERREL